MKSPACVCGLLPCYISTLFTSWAAASSGVIFTVHLVYTLYGLTRMCSFAAAVLTQVIEHRRHEAVFIKRGGRDKSGEGTFY